jgi:cytochrome c oxidase subunit III
MENTSIPKKIHPQKFQLWIAFASIIMAFSGLISAYLVKMAQDNWLIFKLPSIFTISTVVILVSSLTMYLAEKAFKKNQIANYRNYITITAFLGVLFIILQIIGFNTTQHNGVLLTGKGSNAAASFLLAIAGFHILHVLGGVVVLLVQFFRAFSRKKYSSTGIEIVAQYWHFVDILWLVLFVFFLVAKP